MATITIFITYTYYTMTNYNGRTNKETWLVNVHFNPETVEDVEQVKEYIEELEDGLENDFLRDFIDFSAIN